MTPGSPTVTRAPSSNLRSLLVLADEYDVDLANAFASLMLELKESLEERLPDAD